jgi:hypothetical protein
MPAVNNKSKQNTLELAKLACAGLFYERKL